MKSNCSKCPFVKTIKNDITGIYGAACIVLHERYGFGQKRLTDFLNAVQMTWDYVSQIPGVKMEQVCEERTGIVLDQKMKV